MKLKDHNALKNITKRQKHGNVYNDYIRILRLISLCGLKGLRYLFPWHFYLDFIEMPITTRCNLMCPDCANLMPYYRKSYDIDTELLILSIRKVFECTDICGNFRILGGEPFLHPDLKRIIAEIPAEKCLRISIPTNATIIPQDSELYEVMRTKNVTIVLGNYPYAKETQKRLIEKLTVEKVKFEFPKSDNWIDYGKPEKYNRDKKMLKKQFTQCNLRSKSLINGVLYYCPRHAHGYDLGLIDRRKEDYVVVIDNSKRENRRQIRKLMWKHKPVEACDYCLRGTNESATIPRGKNM